MNNYNNFILCYRKPHGINWDCELGYKSVLEIDDRTRELLKEDNHLTTTFFPIQYNIPIALRKMIISNTLSPKIIMYNKPSSANGERGNPIMTPSAVIYPEFSQIPKPKTTYY